MIAPPTLDELGLHYGTDKASTRHNYLVFYDALLSPHRLTTHTVVEIGVKDGASVRMWRDYFGSAQIVGIDIRPECLASAGDRLHVEIGSQVDFPFLDREFEGRQVEVIIDDGSHLWEYQIRTFMHLWGKLEPGGVYVVEDLQTSRADHAGRYGRGWPETAAQFFGRLAQTVAADGAIEGEPVDPFVAGMFQTVEEVVIGRRYCVVAKRAPGVRARTRPQAPSSSRTNL